jgi:hypothetical protein
VVRQQVIENTTLPFGMIVLDFRSSGGLRHARTAMATAEQTTSASVAVRVAE